MQEERQNDQGVFEYQARLKIDYGGNHVFERKVRHYENAKDAKHEAAVKLLEDMTEAFRPPDEDSDTPKAHLPVKYKLFYRNLYFSEPNLSAKKRLNKFLIHVNGSKAVYKKDFEDDDKKKIDEDEDESILALNTTLDTWVGECDIEGVSFNASHQVAYTKKKKQKIAERELSEQLLKQVVSTFSLSNREIFGIRNRMERYRDNVLLSGASENEEPKISSSLARLLKLKLKDSMKLRPNPVKAMRHFCKKTKNKQPQFEHCPTTYTAIGAPIEKHFSLRGFKARVIFSTAGYTCCHEGEGKILALLKKNLYLELAEGLLKKFEYIAKVNSEDPPDEGRDYLSPPTNIWSSPIAMPPMSPPYRLREVEDFTERKQPPRPLRRPSVPRVFTHEPLPPPTMLPDNPHSAPTPLHATLTPRPDTPGSAHALSCQSDNSSAPVSSALLQNWATNQFDYDSLDESDVQSDDEPESVPLLLPKVKDRNPLDKELSHDERAALEKQLDGSEDDIIIHKFRIPISRGTLRRLALPNKKLNDECINFWVARLQSIVRERSHRIFFHNTFFFPKLQQSYKNVERWTTPKKVFNATRQSTLFQLDRIVIPIFEKKQEHFVLVEVAMLEKTIRLYDSLSAHIGPVKRRILDSVQNYLLVEFKAKVGYGEPSTFTEEVVEDLPRQQNGTDCGVFLCWYAQCIVDGVDPGSAHLELIDSLRERLAYEVIST